MISLAYNKFGLRASNKDPAKLQKAFYVPNTSILKLLHHYLVRYKLPEVPSAELGSAVQVPGTTPHCANSAALPCCPQLHCTGPSLAMPKVWKHLSRADSCPRSTCIFLSVCVYIIYRVQHK